MGTWRQFIEMATASFSVVRRRKAGVVCCVADCAAGCVAPSWKFYRKRGFLELTLESDDLAANFRDDGGE